jgi:hypothetical protein
MNTLTWRDVAAPDLGDSMRGIGQFSSLLNNALNGPQQTIGTVDQDVSNRVNSRIAQNLLTYQDPDALKVAIASGDIYGGADPDRVQNMTRQQVQRNVLSLLGSDRYAPAVRSRTSSAIWAS